MRIKIKARALSVCLLLALCVAAHADVQDGQMQQLVVPMQSGAFVTFATQTVPATPQELSFSFIEAEDKSNLIHRVFVDGKGEFFFGYELVVEPVAASKKFSIFVRPLSAEFEQQLRARKALKARRVHPNFNAAAFSNSARPQLVADGDTLALDVLFNPRTGVKLVDVIKVSTDDPRLQEAPLSKQPPRDFTLEDAQLKVTNYKLFVNGEIIHRTTSGCAGPLIWFSLPGRGRFIFSLTPRPGYDFHKIVTVEHNKILFTWDGVRYEWVSILPIVGSGGNWNLWVLHDPAYTSESFTSEFEQSTAGDKSPNAGGGDIGQKLQQMRRKKDPLEFNPQSDAQSKPASAPQKKRVRVVIGAADGVEHLLPK